MLSVTSHFCAILLSLFFIFNAHDEIADGIFILQSEARARTALRIRLKVNVTAVKQYALIATWRLRKARATATNPKH
jgi:hypothetical protein